MLYRGIAAGTLTALLLLPALARGATPLPGGTEIHVNVSTHGLHFDPSAAVFPDGGFVALRELADERPDLGAPLHPRLPYSGVEVVWAVRHEMARTVEDVLARRTRALFLDARASLEAAPAVARLMAAELGESKAWKARQVDAYRKVAAGYILSG